LDKTHIHLSTTDSGASVYLVRGDHSAELKKICECLSEALKYAANPLQERTLMKYRESFQTGDIEAYKESQRTWIKDRKPAVENIIGFVEPYRDPFGTRAEFESLVGLVDVEETKVLSLLTENSLTFIRRLPWAKGYTENNGKGPLEKDFFDPPDFTSLQGRVLSLAWIRISINRYRSSCLLFQPYLYGHKSS
jgi:dipeptidyl-peptidase-3